MQGNRMNNFHLHKSCFFYNKIEKKKHFEIDSKFNTFKIFMEVIECRTRKLLGRGGGGGRER